MLRLMPLARQADTIAAKNPRAEVPEAVRVLAEGLIYESHGFRQHRRGGGLPVAGHHYGPLAAQLAQALAGLVAFEIRHTHWDGAAGALMWLVEGGALPVRRLAPRLAGPMPVPGAEAMETARVDRLRELLRKRIEQYNNRDPAQRNARPRA